MSAPGPTPSQTVGPFLSIGLDWPDGPHAVPEDAPGAFWVRGRVLDGEGEPIPDALIETWQQGVDVGPAGRRPVDGFPGFARSGTPQGEYAVRTVKPAPVVDAQGRTHAPYLAVSVFARGLIDRLVTRLYFADEAAANATDPVLTSLPDDAARATLLAQPSDDGYRLDLVLQGSDETVFFEL